MSLACFECRRGGAFNTLVLFASDGDFDPEKSVSHYPSFYTDCAAFGDFKKVEKSRFMIVEERESQDSWNTGTDGDKLRETKYKFVDETTLAAKLPKIFAALLKTEQRASA
ncbi:MAG: hypothetical protein AAB579_03990 [Patescibacteria group bacterium]